MGEKLARLPSKILDFVNNYEIQYWHKCGRSKMRISDAHLGQREAICLIFSHAFNFFFQISYKTAAAGNFPAYN